MIDRLANALRRDMPETARELAVRLGLKERQVDDALYQRARATGEFMKQDGRWHRVTKAAKVPPRESAPLTFALPKVAQPRKTEFKPMDTEKARLMGASV